MAATASMADTMGSAAKVMGKVNARVNPAEMAAVMRNFAHQTQTMQMTEDMMDDALADAVCTNLHLGVLPKSHLLCPRSQFEDDEVEEDRVVSQVLDEIGIEVGSRLADAPTTRVGVRAPAEAKTDDAEVNATLARLGISH